MICVGCVRRCARASSPLRSSQACWRSWRSLVAVRCCAQYRVGGEVAVTFGTIAAFAVWGVLSSVGNAVAMFLNGLGVVRFQVIVASVMAVTNLLLSIWLAGAVGVAGVVWGSVFAYGLTVCGPHYWKVARPMESERRGEGQEGLHMRTAGLRGRSTRASACLPVGSAVDFSISECAACVRCWCGRAIRACSTRSVVVRWFCRCRTSCRTTVGPTLGTVKGGPFGKGDRSRTVPGPHRDRHRCQRW